MLTQNNFTSASDYITYSPCSEKNSNRIILINKNGKYVLSFYYNTNTRCRKFYELGVTLSHCSVTLGAPAWCVIWTSTV
jgi:hypothetical protein